MAATDPGTLPPYKVPYSWDVDWLGIKEYNNREDSVDDSNLFI